MLPLKALALRCSDLIAFDSYKTAVIDSKDHVFLLLIAHITLEYLVWRALCEKFPFNIWTIHDQRLFHNTWRIWHTAWRMRVAIHAGAPDRWTCC